ncbi:MAG: lytic murein transglycosylase [Pseudomonadota bacterium]|jgi:membrane-bound lytic murein transglycosylase B
MRLLTIIILGLSLSISSGNAEAAKKKKKNAPASSTGFEHRAEVQSFIKEMAALGLNSRELNQRFAQHRPNTEVIRLMDAPVLRPAKWYEYYPRFLQADRINAGHNYLKNHQSIFKRAQEVYKVSPSLIAAIIGVETFYGRVTGSNEVFNALATLCFDYPRRSQYFCSELKEYLLHTQADGAIYKKAKGSFAGAMGLPQFMPSSIKNFAVDFDADGHVDLWNSHADIIASVANYFAGHGWEENGIVMLPVQVHHPDTLKLIQNQMSERQAVSKWLEAGVSGEGLDKIPALESAGLIVLEDPPGESEAVNHKYYLAFNNFYVITRYNRSRLYASAVWSLALELSK